jgi:hypothetical protein
MAAHSLFAAADPEHAQDRLGCLLFGVRLGCGMSLLWVIMFVTMVLIGLISLIFYR